MLTRIIIPTKDGQGNLIENNLNRYLAACDYCQTAPAMLYHWRNGSHMIASEDARGVWDIRRDDGTLLADWLIGWDDFVKEWIKLKRQG